MSLSWGFSEEDLKKRKLGDGAIIAFMAFNLRLTPSLDLFARKRAEEMGISLNAFVCVAMTAYLDEAFAPRRGRRVGAVIPPSPTAPLFDAPESVPAPAPAPQVVRPDLKAKKPVLTKSQAKKERAARHNRERDQRNLAL